MSVPETSVLDEVAAFPAYALIRVRESDTVTVLAGSRSDIDQLADIPIDTTPAGATAYDGLVLVPYAQVTERGFEAHQDGTPLSVIAADYVREVPLTELTAILPPDPVEFADSGDFETTDEQYASMVRDVLADEIGRGESANLVLARDYRARLANWGHRGAWSVFRRLLLAERGAHWTFCIFTGDRHLIGASPERHIGIDDGQVRMNPISGTFRLRGQPGHAARKRALLDFLADEKEIYELFMVVDEELKMMCHICNQGGQVLGPYLKPMTHLVHTEYLLAGRTDRDVRDVLRDSMFAATVTGSPVENACRLIRRYEHRGRGYYAALAALVGRNADGSSTVDAPILIRTADIDTSGNLLVRAGATLVRDSDPEYETAETHAKAAGILSAFGLADGRDDTSGHDAFAYEDELLIALGSRNNRLSSFWLSDQSATRPVDGLAGKSVLILDGEDDFVNMLSHVLRFLGLDVDLLDHRAYRGPRSLGSYDLVLVGPGPGDPRDQEAPKIATFRAALSHLLDSGRPFLAVCLGHQVLAGLLGLDLDFKDIVFQGTQDVIEIDGEDQTVGFYNTFVARVSHGGPPDGVSVQADPESGDVHSITGRSFRSVQFHPESVLTQNGPSLLRRLVGELLLG